MNKTLLFIVTKKRYRYLPLKIGYILFLSIIFHLPVNSAPSQKITLKGNDLSIKECLNAIEEQTEYLFIYDADVNVGKKVSVNLSNKSIKEVLENLSSTSGINYVQKGTYIILSNQKSKPNTIEIIEEKQQKRIISGIVTDIKGDPIIGANVVEKGTTNGIITDLDGKFSLSIASHAILQISYVGYNTREIKVDNQSTLSIQLEENTEALDEVVVVAYGTAKKKDLTGSISTIDANSIKAQSLSSVTNALEGSVPGVQVAQLDGQPGLDMGIRVRGLGSASQNNADALIVIDGVPATQSNVLSSLNSKDIASLTVLKDAASTALYGSRGANGVILITTNRGKTGKAKISFEGRWGVTQMGPNSYDKINKAADMYEFAWQAIYNSVRYGNNSGTSANYSTNVQNPNMSHESAALFASQHLFDYAGSTTNFQRNSLGNWMLYNVPGANYLSTGSGSTQSSTMTGAYLVNTDGKINPDAKLLFEADSYKKELLKDALRQEYNVSVNGGSEKSDYYVSLGFLDNPSYIVGSQFKRYNIRSNFNSQLLSWLKAGINTAYAYRNTQSQATRYGRNPGNSQQNVFRYINNQNTLISLYARDENGNIIYKNGEKEVHTNEGDTYSPLGATGTGVYGSNNIIKIIDMDEDRSLSNDLNIKTYAEIKFLNDFTFNTNLALDKYFVNRTRYQNSKTGQVAGEGAFGKVVQNYGYLTLQQLLNWGHDYGKHHIDALAGHEYNQYDLEETTYKSSDELVPGFITYVNFVGRYQGGTFSNPGGGKEKTAMEAYFSRANYIYDNKYYLSGSLRMDGSSKFKLKENRWGTFWSIGGGWRISSEKFMEGMKGWLNNLKLRTSYGIIGNQNGVSNYSGYQTWTYSAASYASSTSGGGDPSSYKLTKGSYVNENLTWENVHTFDLGLDFSLFDRFHGSIDYYNRNTVNAIWDKPIANSMGQSSISSNSAGIRNRGIEIDLNVDLIKNKDLYWSFSTNGTHYTTILTKVPAGVGSNELNGCWTASADAWTLAGSGSFGAISYLRGVGKPYYNMYLYKYGGVDQSTGLPLFYHKVTQSDVNNKTYENAKVGEDVVTTNYTKADRYEFGDAIPKWIGGFSTTVEYKNFDFTALFAYQIGGKFYSMEYGNGFYLSEDWTQSGLSAELIKNTWTESNKNAKFPMVMYNNTYGNGSTLGTNLFTDMALFDASYFNVKSFTLGYTFQNNFLKKYHLSGLRLFITGNNLLMFTSHSGIDPRMSLVGGMEVGASTYPYSRTYSFGINLDF